MDIQAKPYLGRLTIVMLFRNLTVFVFLVCFTSLLIAADVSGKWAFEVDLGIGTGSPSFVFQQDGEKLTGTYSGEIGEAQLTGTITGNTIKFQFETELGPVKYEGSITDSDNMKGTADYVGQITGEWTAKRSK